MKPFRSFLYVLVVLISLAIISWAVPENGFTIFGKLKIKFPSIKRVFNDSTIKDKGISIEILQAEKAILKNDTVTPTAFVDTLDVDSLINVIQYLEFQGNDKASLVPFFRALQHNNSLIHILHYGDSQIEGDRITGYLRSRFQQRFGGNGAGLLSLVKVNNIDGPVKIENSGNWKRYTLFGKTSSDISHKKYGAMLSFSRFAPVYNDTAITDLQVNYEGKITLSQSLYSGQNTFNFDRIRIFFANNRKPVIAELLNGGKLLDFETLLPADSLNCINWDIDGNQKEISIKFSGKDSPDIYALSLESRQGICFDNIPLRGSSGTDFTKGDPGLLKEMYYMLNVKLLIFEFGVNIVPNVLEDYSFYENWIYGQLAALRRIHPDMGIIVIGISDMSRKTEDGMETYPNIEKIRDAQRNAAFRANCAFWDLYSAMGGKNSMPSWVNADPPLAAKDYTHLSPRGARIISEIFFNALMYEYNLFKEKNGKLTQ